MVASRLFVVDRMICGFLTEVRNKSHDGEAGVLSLLPVELAIGANLGRELAHECLGDLDSLVFRENERNDRPLFSRYPLPIIHRASLEDPSQIDLAAVFIRCQLWIFYSRTAYQRRHEEYQRRHEEYQFAGMKKSIRQRH